MTIDILMGTYNGEEYLREQIASLLAQTMHDWRLLIRDDGSTDGTVPIIEEYVQKYPGKIFQIDVGGKNLGVVANFGRLMEVSLAHAQAEYFMFCDQDDVWYPDKVAVTYGALLDMEITYGNQLPLMVHTDARLVNEDMHPTHRSFHRALSHQAQRTCLAYELVQNTAHGCTIMMNKALLQLAVPMPAEARMHDMWVHLLAQACGHAQYLDEPTLDYRQHGKNVIGALPQTHDAQAARSKAGRTMAASFAQAQAATQRLNGKLDSDTRAVLQGFIDVVRQPWRQGTRFLLSRYCPKPRFKNAIRIMLR